MPRYQGEVWEKIILSKIGKLNKDQQRLAAQIVKRYLAGAEQVDWSAIKGDSEQYSLMRAMEEAADIAASCKTEEDFAETKVWMGSWECAPLRTSYTQTYTGWKDIPYGEKLHREICLGNKKQRYDGETLPSCKWGHDISEENTIFLPSGKTCRICWNEEESDKAWAKRA